MNVERDRHREASGKALAPLPCQNSHQVNSNIARNPHQSVEIRLCHSQIHSEQFLEEGQERTKEKRDKQQTHICLK